MTRQAISAAAEIIWRSLFFIYFSFLFFIFLFSYLLSFFELVYPAIILKFSIGSLFPDCLFYIFSYSPFFPSIFFITFICLYWLLLVYILYPRFFISFLSFTLFWTVLLRASFQVFHSLRSHSFLSGFIPFSFLASYPSPVASLQHFLSPAVLFNFFELLFDLFVVLSFLYSFFYFSILGIYAFSFIFLSFGPGFSRYFFCPAFVSKRKIQPNIKQDGKNVSW